MPRLAAPGSPITAPPGTATRPQHVLPHGTACHLKLHIHATGYQASSRQSVYVLRGALPAWALPKTLPSAMATYTDPSVTPPFVRTQLQASTVAGPDESAVSGAGKEVCAADPAHSPFTVSHKFNRNPVLSITMAVQDPAAALQAFQHVFPWLQQQPEDVARQFTRGAPGSSAGGVMLRATADTRSPGVCFTQREPGSDGALTTTPHLLVWAVPHQDVAAVHERAASLPAWQVTELSGSPAEFLVQDADGYLHRIQSM